MGQNRIDELNQAIGYFTAQKERASSTIYWVFNTAIEAMEDVIEMEKAPAGVLSTGRSTKRNSHLHYNDKGDKNQMEIKITVTADDALLKALNGIALGLQGRITPVSADTKEAQEKFDQAFANLKERQEKEIIQETTEPEPQPEQQTAPTPEPVQEPEPKKGDGQYTLEQVREAFGNLSKAKGREVPKGILADLGVKSVSNLQPEQFTEAMERIQEALQ